MLLVFYFQMACYTTISHLIGISFTRFLYSTKYTRLFMLPFSHIPYGRTYLFVYYKFYRIILRYKIMQQIRITELILLISHIHAMIIYGIMLNGRGHCVVAPSNIVPSRYREYITFMMS